MGFGAARVYREQWRTRNSDEHKTMDTEFPTEERILFTLVEQSFIPFRGEGEKIIVENKNQDFLDDFHFMDNLLGYEKRRGLLVEPGPLAVTIIELSQ